MKKFAALFALCAGLTSLAEAAVTNRPVLYHDGDAVLEGQLVWNDTATGKQPGVLVFHQWGGLGDYEMMRARELATDGYAVFVADVYGQGVRPTTSEERVAEVTKYRGNRLLMRSRAKAALDAFHAQPIELSRVAAIGFCFGGTVAMELARSKAPLDAVVSIHGGLDTDHPAEPGSLPGLPVLILQGGDDPYATDAQLDTCRNELRAAKAAWQVAIYGGAVHAFTDPGAGTDPSKGVAYNPAVSKRALRDLGLFLDEHLRPH